VLSRQPAAEPLLGCEVPRIFTPPLRPLTSETSYGFSVIEFATEVLEITLFPWQKWLLIHALETLPGGALRFRTVVVLVARQNGKSTLSQVLALWFMFVKACALIIGTAQDLDVAEEIWQGAVDIVEAIPELDEQKQSVVMTNGKKSLDLLTRDLKPGGPRYKVKAANRRAGRSLSADLVLLDELREHQNWLAWAAVTKTTMARAAAQIWALSNAGDITSVVLRHLRRMAHKSLGDPDGWVAMLEAREKLAQAVDEAFAEAGLDFGQETDDSLFLAEWSARPDRPKWDRRGWAEANPALNHPNGIAERTMASACATDPGEVFSVECLCQWLEGSMETLFGRGKWSACQVPEAKRPKVRLVVGVAVSWDRQWTSIGVAAWFDGKKILVGAHERRQGTAWAPKYLKKLQRKLRCAVVIDSRGPAKSLRDDLELEGVDVTTYSTEEVLDACAGVFDRVQEQVIVHMGDSELDSAVDGAQWRPVGDRQALGRKTSTSEVSMLEAVILAAREVWLNDYAIRDSFL